MKTKTFSGRADAEKLAYADARTRKEFGMSYGQYCASTLLDAVYENAPLPQEPENPMEHKKQAIAELKRLSAQFVNPELDKLSDAQIRDLIASRYEA